MRKRFAAGLLAACAVGAGFMLPANASPRGSNHVAKAYAAKGLALNASRVMNADSRPDSVNIAWTAAAAMPVAVAENNGGAVGGKVFYVPGGYTNFNTPSTNATVQAYNLTSNTWTNDTANPIPTVPGLVAGLADAAVCFDPVGKQMHIVDGVGFDSSGNGFLITQHWEYNPAKPTGQRWTQLSSPVLSTGDTWFAQDQGCGFIGGKMYLYGGYGIISPTQPAAIIEQATWSYDPATDTWSDTGKLMVTGRLWMGYTSSATNAFAAGGTNNLTNFAPLATTEKFTPATGWAAAATLPTALLGPGEGNVKTHLLIWGGQDSTGTTQNKTYHCLLPNCTSFSTTAFNVPSSKSFSAFGSGASNVFNAGGQTGTFVPVTTSEHLP